MNREIKFRCWIKPYYKFDKCKKDYRMIYPHLEKDNWYVIDCQSQTLMDGEGGKISDYKMYIQQFTGLKDKNGKDIYEGDIITNFGVDKEIKIRKYEICFNNDGARFCAYNRQAKDTTGINKYEMNLCEVIGNIFENPELINK